MMYGYDINTSYLGGDVELGDNHCGTRVGVLRQLPGAGKLQYILNGIGGIGQLGSGVSQALDQGLNLIKVSLLPEQPGLLEVARQCQL